MKFTFAGVRPESLDRIEKFIFAVIFAAFAFRMIVAYMTSGSLVTIFYLFDQFLVLGFILARRSTQAISLRGDDWIAGFAGTLAPLLLAPPGDSPILPAFGILVLMLTGTSVHVMAKLTLRRSFGVVAANRGIKASGLYKLVRHPMYLGYMITQFGLFLAGPTAYNFAIILLCWSLFIWRIVSEERLLSEDPEYKRTANYRLVPGLF